jgi:beta-glucosidase/6-phospho-beta-glucosidase/beta-galactosidase
MSYYDNDPAGQPIDREEYEAWAREQAAKELAAALARAEDLCKRYTAERELVSVTALERSMAIERAEKAEARATEAERLHSVLHDVACGGHMHTLLRHEHSCAVDAINTWRIRTEKAEAALSQIREWIDGYDNPTTGMGSGMHQEMWPMLGPGARKRLREILEEVRP